MDFSVAKSGCPQIMVSLPLSFHLFNLLILSLTYYDLLISSLCSSHHLCACGWSRTGEVKDKYTEHADTDKHT
jgi:hypothetical protein